MKKKFQKSATALMLTLVMLLSIFSMTAMAYEYDAEIDAFPAEVEFEMPYYALEQNAIDIEPFSTGFGTIPLIGALPNRLPTPLHNNIIGIWVGDSSSITSGRWQQVWGNAPTSQPSFERPPPTLSIDTTGITHIAIRHSELSPRFNVTHVLNNTPTQPIGQPGVFMNQAYSSNGLITPVGGAAAAFVRTSVFRMPCNVSFRYQADFIGVPQAVERFTINFQFTGFGPPIGQPQLPQGVRNETQLQTAIANAPMNTQTIIDIADNFTISSPIVVPVGRNILLRTNDIFFTRTLSQRNPGQRHFFVGGHLTLGRGITLSGGLAGVPFSAFDDVMNATADMHTMDAFEQFRDAGTRDFASRTNSNQRAFSEMSEMYAIPLNAAVASGGVVIIGGGTLTITDGSVIENNMSPFGGAVQMEGTATQRAILNIQGGVIRNNIANYGGAVDAFGNSRINMTSGTVSGNIAFGDGGAFWIGTGTTASGQGFNMTGGGIHNNSANVDGGAIFTTMYAQGYWNIFTGPSTNFSGNSARFGVWPPPVANRPAHIRSATSSVVDHILNNFDIIYLGHLG